MIEWVIYKGAAVEALTGETQSSFSNYWTYPFASYRTSSSYKEKLTENGRFITRQQTVSSTGVLGGRTVASIHTGQTTYATYTSDYSVDTIYGYTSTIISTYGGWSYPPYDWEDPDAPFPEPFTYTETRALYKAVTAQISTKGSCWTTQPTTINSESTTRFTTTTQNISVLGVSYEALASTEIAVTTTGSTAASYAHGQHKYDRVIEASPGEVFYVVEAGDLDFWEPESRPFLTEIASTATRITIPWVPLLTTRENIYTSSIEGPVAYTGTGDEYLGSSRTTDTYRELTTISSHAVTFTEYGGVIPTPTRTSSEPTFRRTTTQSTFQVAYTQSWHPGPDQTILYPVNGKVSVFSKEGLGRNGGWYEYNKEPIFVYDEIHQVTTSSYSVKGNIECRIDTGVTPDFPNTTAYSGMGTVVSTTTPVRWGKTFAGNTYAPKAREYGFGVSLCHASGTFMAFRGRRHGVMTSPDSYYGRLSIAGKTLLTGTTSSSNGATITTTFSPTYARFHRSDGGLALMPTSADSTAYIADLTAVTYTTGPTSNATTTSQVVSANEEGVTRLLRDGWQFDDNGVIGAKIGGAAGFLETYYAYVSGFCKINGSKSFLPVTGGFTETTESTASASWVEFPYVVGVEAAAQGYTPGRFFHLGNYSYTDILND